MICVRRSQRANSNSSFSPWSTLLVTTSAAWKPSFGGTIRKTVWSHPDAFIPLAEETGLIIPLGEWVIREACATAVRWPDDLKVAVNLSPAQFRSPGLVQVIFNALAHRDWQQNGWSWRSPRSILMHDSEATLAKLYQLRELGVRIAMDDFGTGYSSLSYLQSFPFDKIKIDRSFVKDITDSAGSLNIVRAVAALAKGLGMTTTAEGVETIEQFDTVTLEGLYGDAGLFVQSSSACRPNRAPDLGIEVCGGAKRAYGPKGSCYAHNVSASLSASIPPPRHIHTRADRNARIEVEHVFVVKANASL